MRFAFSLVALLAVAAVANADAVVVQPSGDASGQAVVFTLDGNATCSWSGCIAVALGGSAVCPASCNLAASEDSVKGSTYAGFSLHGDVSDGLGFAMAPHGDARCSYPSCIAVGLGGDASCGGWICLLMVGRDSATGTSHIVIATEGDATGAVDLAASASGNASSTESEGFGVAVAPHGEARGQVPLSVDGTCSGRSRFDYQQRRCFAVSDDTSAEAYWMAISRSGNSSALLAASGTGNSTSRCFSDCAALSGSGDAECSGSRCVAVSAAGNASSECDNRDACLAASGTGHAASGSHAISACDTLSAFGRPEACTKNLPAP